MRLFVAIDIPTTLGARLAELRNELLSCPSMRLAPTHLTLKFLGEVHREKVAKVVAALNEVSFSSVKLQTTKLGTFAHVLWLGLKLNKELAQLQQRVARAVRPYTTHDPRPFKPHLTLARFERLTAKEQELVDRLPKERRIEEKWKSESFALYSSELTPAGPRYEEVARFFVNNNIENNNG